MRDDRTEPAPSSRCLIPAAGRGTRLWPVTRTVPKPLLPVGTRPMLQWCLTEALEGGFAEVAVVVGPQQPLLERYLSDGEWREGILPALRERAAALEIELLRQEGPVGVVDAILAARSWVDQGLPFAVLLPDNVRISGPTPITAGHLAEAAANGVVLVAAHKLGPEVRGHYRNLGRAVLEPLVPAGSRPRVIALQARGEGPFRAAPEGSWRIAPRYTVTAPWVATARAVREQAALAGIEADDVEVHRRLVSDGRLFALCWQGTLVDAGHPEGYLWAQHLIHEATNREREEETEESRTALLQIETSPGES